MASLPQAGQSVQPLQRQLAWSLATVLPLEVALSLELQVFIVGRIPNLQNSPSLPPHGLGKQSREGAVCSSHTLTHGTGQGGTGCVLTCSTRAVGCHTPLPVTLSSSGDLSHCQPQVVVGKREVAWQHGMRVARMAAWRAQHSVTAWNASAQTFPGVPAPLWACGNRRERE